jgi:ABC-type oligopeptide transport system substrate-binding subunit
MAAAHRLQDDMAKAKALMAEAGVAGGFETTLSFDLGGATIGEPMAVLIQESLGQIGIKTQINKIPGATWRAALLKKDMPLLLNRFGGWLNFPEYFFFWCYHGQNAVFNTMSYQNPKMDKIIDNARFAESKPLYDAFVKDMIQLATTRCRASRCSSPAWTWRCRRTCRATCTGSICSRTTGSCPRLETPHAMDSRIMNNTPTRRRP